MLDTVHGYYVHSYYFPHHVRAHVRTATGPRAALRNGRRGARRDELTGIASRV